MVIGAPAGIALAALGSLFRKTALTAASADDQVARKDAERRAGSADPARGIEIRVLRGRGRNAA